MDLNQAASQAMFGNKSKEHKLHITIGKAMQSLEAVKTQIRQKKNSREEILKFVTKALVDIRTALDNI